MVLHSNYRSFDPQLKRKIQIFDVTLALIILGFTIWSLINYNHFKTELQIGVQVFGLLGLFVITCFLESIPQFINPLFLLVAVIASHINVYLAILVTVLASITGSCLGFWAGKHFGPKYVYILLEKKQIEKTLRFWDKYGKYVVFFGALEPLPYFPLIYGALSMRWRDFFLYGVIPRIIGLVIPAYLFHLGLWQFGV